MSERSWLAVMVGLLAAANALACSSDALQPGVTGNGMQGSGTGGRAGSGGAGGVAGAAGFGGTGGDIVGTGTGGAAGTASSGGAGGGGPPPPTGRKSYVVQSQYVGPSGTTSVAIHTFTLVADPAAGQMMAGSTAGPGGIFPITSLGGGQFTVGLGMNRLNFPLDAGSCSTHQISYASLTFTMHADATLTGSGAGSLLTFSGDVGSSSPVMMTLTGMPDGVPPVLTSSALTGVVDPFDSFELLSSEPLPPDVRPELVDGAGTRTPLIPDGASAAAASFQFAGPAVFLPYATSYLIALDGVHDFAGSAAQGGPLSLMTMPAPPLLAEDGFESTPPPVVTGGQVVTADTVPPIAGSQSLYVAPGTNLAPLQLRLAISPGDTVLRFSYRVVKLASLSIAASYELGVPGAPIGSLLVDETIAAGAGTTTTIAGVGTVTLGPIQTAAATLPVGSTGELTLRRSGTVTTCNSLPQPPTNGIIIDDLRTE